MKRLAAALALAVPLIAVAGAGSITLGWNHGSGPFSYNVYSTTNLLLPMRQWPLITNVTALRVTVSVQETVQFFAVTCVDTNTGLESDYATR